MARLPQPGGDSGNWGNILNDYLSQAHKPDGSIKDNSVGSAQLQDNAVTSSAIADESITELLLTTGLQTKLNAVISRYNRPSAFTWDWGFPVRFDGYKYTTDYDVSTRRNQSLNTFSIHTVLGSDTNGDGSASKPFRTWTRAYTAASDGDTIIWANKGTFYRNSHAPTIVNKSLNIIAKYPGETIMVRTDAAIVWTANATYPNVYEAARTNVRKVVDISLDPEGADLTRVVDLATCNSTRSSWYQATDGTGSVYVHRLNHEAPDPTAVFPLLNDGWLTIDTDGRTSDMNFYLEGFTIIGGLNGLTVTSSNQYRLAFTWKSCQLYHCGYANHTATANDLTNGYSVVGNVDAWSQKVTIAHSALDCFNYHHHSYGGGTQEYVPTAVEIDCIAHDAGTGQISQSLGVGTSQNASTCHERAKIIRIGGKYWKCYGTPVIDITGSLSINLSCESGHSTSDAVQDVTKSGFRSGSGTNEDAIMWILACHTWGVVNGLYVAGGSTIHYDNLTANASDPRSGSGTYIFEP